MRRHIFAMPCRRHYLFYARRDYIFIIFSCRRQRCCRFRCRHRCDVHATNSSPDFHYYARCFAAYLPAGEAARVIFFIDINMLMSFFICHDIMHYLFATYFSAEHSYQTLFLLVYPPRSLLILPTTTPLSYYCCSPCFITMLSLHIICCCHCFSHTYYYYYMLGMSFAMLCHFWKLGFFIQPHYCLSSPVSVCFQLLFSSAATASESLKLLFPPGFLFRVLCKA